jgi:thioredoxin reductase (NADPH)
MYDIIIIGSGPAGFSSGIYAARFGLKSIIVGESLGGTANNAHLIENYPGFKSISGMELMEKFAEHVKSVNVEIKNSEVVNIENAEGHFVVITRENEKLDGKNLILAMGTVRNKLNIPGEDEFLGKGVSYCATCDGPFFRDKIVSVVGGSDAACNTAVQLAEYCKKVYVFYRKEKLRAEPFWVKKIQENKKIEVVHNINVKEITGDKFVEAVKLDNGKTIKVDGVFIEIGGVPQTSIIKNMGVKTDDSKSIIVDSEQRTNIKGIYAAGDITTGSNKWSQVITASAEGAVAARSVFYDSK